MTDAPPDLATPTLLPPAWYVDEAVYQRERAAIFARSWLLFGPEASLAEPGSWQAQTIIGWPLLVTRGPDGTLRGFHNACRHRGAMVCADGDGEGATLSCPYHGWTYGLDGGLLTTPRFGAEDFDRAAHGLMPVRVETWRGLVFVAISEQTPPLLQWLGSLPGFSADFPMAPEMNYFGRFVVEGAANWKLFCENTVEGYHLPYVHERLARAVRGTDMSITGHDDGRLVLFEVGFANDGVALRGDRGRWPYLFPGLQLALSAKSLKAERIEPLGPGRLRITSWAWFADATEAEKRDSFAWGEQITREDIGVCETVQRTMEAGAYRGGVLSPIHERHTARFQRLVHDALDSKA